MEEFPRILRSKNTRSHNAPARAARDDRGSFRDICDSGDWQRLDPPVLRWAVSSCQRTAPSAAVRLARVRAIKRSEYRRRQSGGSWRRAVGQASPLRRAFKGRRGCGGSPAPRPPKEKTRSFPCGIPHLVALRRELGLPRHPAQIVVTGAGCINVETSRVFNVPEVSVYVVAGPVGCRAFERAISQRPSVQLVPMTGDDLRRPLECLGREHGIRRISAARRSNDCIRVARSGSGARSVIDHDRTRRRGAEYAVLCPEAGRRERPQSCGNVTWIANIRSCSNISLCSDERHCSTSLIPSMRSHSSSVTGMTDSRDASERESRERLVGLDRGERDGAAQLFHRHDVNGVELAGLVGWIGIRSAAAAFAMPTTDFSSPV